MSNKVRTSLKFALRVFVVCIIMIGPLLLSDFVYTTMFIHSLNAQSRYVQSYQPDQSDQHDTVIRSSEKIADLSGRVMALEKVKTDIRLALIESKLDSQSMTLKMILAAAIAQFLKYLSEGVTWIQKKRRQEAAED